MISVDLQRNNPESGSLVVSLSRLCASFLVVQTVPFKIKLALGEGGSSKLGMASRNFGQMAKMFEKYVKHVKGIEGLLSTGKLVSLEEGKVVYETEVTREQCNAGETMHGAFAALLVDNLTGAAICTKMTTDEDMPMFSGVSVSMNINYLRASKLGETVTATAEVLKVGRNLAFAQCEIVGKADGKLRVTGQHTKFVGQSNY